MYAQLDALRDAGELQPAGTPWSPEEDAVLFTEAAGCVALGVLLKREPADVWDRRYELYVVDTVEQLRALPAGLCLLDSNDEVRLVTDVENILLPAAVIMGSPQSGVRELKGHARRMLDRHYDLAGGAS